MLQFLKSSKVISACVLAGSMIVVSGCGNTEAPSTASTATPNPNVTDQPSDVADNPTDVTALKQKLVGIWLGQAYLDDQVLVLKLQNLPAEQQTAVLQTAQTFLTTVIAKDFRSDGTMENDIEVTPFGGQPQRLGGLGNWRIVESQADRAVIETTTQLEDGSLVTEQQLYRFYPEGDRVAVAVSTGGVIDQCSPLIILQRQNVSRGDLAEQPTGTQLK